MSDEKEKTPSGAADTAQTSVQSRQFWFEDGNVVLKAEGTLFRIHRSIMVRHFRVFEDMFSVGFHSTAPDQPCTPDGCPIVHLQDPQGDIKLVLRIIYEPLYATAFWKGLNVNQILALHRFGMKYQGDAMIRPVADRLHSEFPRKLDDFLAIYTPHLTHEGDGACQCGALVCSQESLIKLINYAMECDLQAFLGAACFLASRLSISDIISGVPISGGGVMSLSPKLQKMLLNGQRFLQRFVVDRSFPWIYRYWPSPPVPTEDCSHTATCQYDFRTHWERNAIDHFVSRPEAVLHIVMVEFDNGSWATPRSSYCSKCTEALIAHYYSSRQKIWDSLPEIYGFPPWAELVQ